MRRLVLLALFLFAASARAEESETGCAASPVLVGSCVTVHGRMTACTGIPNVRIWIVGTKRVPGVADATGNVAGDKQLPGGLDKKLFVSPPCSRAAFGDFTVCPLTPSKPGVMQMVCVESAARVRVTDW